MYCKRLTLRNYRNITAAQVEFSPGVNIIYGKNAQGKTNLLEAVYVFARGKSFRGASDRELCKKDGDAFFTATNEYFDGERENELEIRHSEKKTQRFYNGIKLERTVDMISRFRAVLFCPDNLDIVRGSPADRRDFLNIAISQFSKDYIYMLQSYRTALDNRNALLHRIPEAGAQSAARTRLLDNMAVWNAQLAKYAARIAKARREYVDKISPFAEFTAAEISDGKEKLRVQYGCDASDPSDIERSETEYLKLYTDGLERDITAGSTQRGIHRDDMNLRINGDVLRQWGSQGQKRTAVLALKLSEGEICRQYTGEYPVFLFDDVNSELDAERRRYLLRRADGKQFIITSCEEEKLECDATVIRAENGCFTPERTS